MTIRNNTLYAGHIVLTSKTASEWTAGNPILLKGELGIESDTLKIKCGNGSDTWSSHIYLDAGIQTALTNLTVRVAHLEELAEAIMKTTTSVINNIMRGEENV